MRYYFISFNAEGRFGNGYLTTNTVIQINDAEQSIKKGEGVKNATILYYKELSKEEVENLLFNESIKDLEHIKHIYKGIH